jgi:LysR family glycine cleavage system transcriptional activator
VKHLEQVLGVALFQRLHKRLVLTPRGEDYLSAVSDALDRLSTATNELAHSLKVRTLRVGISPKLAETPAEFLSALGGDAGELRFIRATSSDEVADLLSGALDALVRPGPGPYPGLHAEEVVFTDESGVSRSAMLATWPGLARCRELEEFRGLLSGQKPD